MITFEKCKPDHLKYIVPHSDQLDEYKTIMGGNLADSIVGAGLCLSAWFEGSCVGAAGVATHWNGRGEAWMLGGAKLSRFLLPVARKMLYVLDNTPHRRVDMAVVRSNGNGHALARLLKFKPEAWLEKYHVSGEDVMIYKRIKT